MKPTQQKPIVSSTLSSNQLSEAEGYNRAYARHYRREPRPILSMIVSAIVILATIGMYAVRFF